MANLSAIPPPTIRPLLVPPDTSERAPGTTNILREAVITTLWTRKPAGRINIKT